MTKKKSSRKLIDVFVSMRPRSGQIWWKKKAYNNAFVSLLPALRNRAYVEDLHLNANFHFSGLYGGDLDNLLKALLDAIQQYGFIGNDRQIKSISASVEENSLMEGIHFNLSKR